MNRRELSPEEIEYLISLREWSEKMFKRMKKDIAGFRRGPPVSTEAPDSHTTDDKVPPVP